MGFKSLIKNENKSDEALDDLNANIGERSTTSKRTWRKRSRKSSHR